MYDYFRNFKTFCLFCGLMIGYLGLGCKDKPQKY